MDEIEETKKNNQTLTMALKNAEKNEEITKSKLLNYENDIKKIPILRKQIDRCVFNLSVSIDWWRPRVGRIILSLLISLGSILFPLSLWQSSMF